MRFTQLDSGDPKDGRAPVDVGINRLFGLFLVLKGTTADGETLLPSDVGQIRIERNGKQKQGETFDFFHAVTDLRGGYPPTINPAGGASRLGAVIPFGFKKIPNTMDIRSKEELDVFLDFDASTLGTRFGDNAAEYTLYGITAPGVPERYELIVRPQDVQSNGAGRRDMTVNGQNTGALYLRDKDDAVGDIQAQVDGETMVDTIPLDVLLDGTRIENSVEDSSVALAQIGLIQGGSLAEASNENVDLTAFFEGAGTLEVTAVQASTAGVDAQASVERVKRYLESHGARGLSVPGRRSGAPAGAARR